MWVSVLGPVQVHNDEGEVLPASSVRLRALLAAFLLCGVNRTVSVDRLIDRVWGAESSESSSRSLQVYVHRLRALLGSDRLVRDYSGYRLVLESGELDAWVFEKMAEDAREARLLGDPRRAAELYRTALASWRGDRAYQDVAEFAELAVDRERLAESRLSVLASRIEADLAVGDGLALVGELEGLVDQHPLREQFRVQLMMALHRAGRSEEALRSYRDFQQLLIDEHGLEPGASSRDLAARIADRDPELLSSADHPPPAQLPDSDAVLTGRDDLVRSVATQLVPLVDEPMPNATVVAIAGPGGVGKSAVQLRAAYAVAYAYPDGQLYANLLGATPGQEPADPLTVLTEFLRALGQPQQLIPSTVDEAAARFRSLTSGRRVLVVLDDAYDLAQVRPLLPGADGPAALVTSRPVLAALDAATRITLDPLAANRAVELLAADLGEKRVEAEPEAAAEIVRLTAGLPLALRIVGARLASSEQSLASFGHELTASRDLLEELDRDELSVRASFELSYRALTPDAADLFDVLGVLDVPDITGQVIHAVSGGPVSRVRRRVDELVEAQLVRPVPAASDRYTLHDLIKLYARRKAAEHIDDARRETLIRRLLHSWVATARAASASTLSTTRGNLVDGISPEDLIAPGLDLETTADSVAWIRAESGNVVTVVRRVSELPVSDAPAIAALAVALLGPMSSQSFAPQLIEIDLLALDAIADVDQHEYADLIRKLSMDLANSHLQMGHLEEVLRLTKAEAERCQENGDTWGLASAYQGAGLAYSNLPARQQDAREAFENALALHRGNSNSYGEANTLNNLGNLALENEDLEAALEYLEQARELSGPHRQLQVHATALGNIGEVHYKSGRRTEALEFYQRAISTAREVGHSRIELLRLWDAGDLLQEMGDHERAREHWRGALELGIETGLIARERAEAILAKPVPPMPKLLYRY